MSRRLYNGVRLLDRPCLANVRRLDIGVIPMIVAMHRNGILIDQEHFRRLQGDLTVKLREAEATFRDLARIPRGREFNLASPKQVGRLLFEELRIQKGRESLVKRTASGDYSTDDEVLSLFQKQVPVAGAVLDWRGYHKLLTTYAYKIPAMAREQGGRIHTEFLLTRTATGRFASKNINLQNIPTRSDWGREIRNGFVAAPGYRLVSLDLSQIEMVVAAHISGDTVMRQVFLEGLDIHNKTACAIFHLDEARIERLARAAADGTATPDEAAEFKTFKQTQRLPCKTLGFGILYGVTPGGLQTQIAAADGPWWEESMCEQLIRDWFGVYTGVADWMEATHQRARRYKCVWDLFGRVRQVPGVRSVHKHIVNEALRQCGNMPIQSTAGGILKLAMAWIMDELVTLYPEGHVRPLMTIHDELIFEVVEDRAEDFAEAGQQMIESVVELSVPVRSSRDIAERWGDMK